MTPTEAAPLRILYLEDNPSDAELVALELRHDGFDIDLTRVDTRADFEACLARGVDLVLADFALPTFTGLDAIKLLKQRQNDTPVILVSGTIGEEDAVEAMKAGAFDYLLKGKLTRLGVAISNALQEKRLRDEKREAEEAMRASEKRYRLLFENNPMPMWVYSTTDLRFLAVNDAALLHYGYARDEFLNMTIEDIRPPEELGTLRTSLTEQSRRQKSGPWKHRKKDGTIIDAEIFSYDIEFLGMPGRLVLANDITERRHAEQALRESEERFRLLYQTSPDAILLVNTDDPHVRLPIIDCNEAACRMNGYTREELLGQSIAVLEATHTDMAALDDWIAEQARQKGVVHFESTHRHKDGHIFPVEISLSRLQIGGRNFSLSIERDITERKAAEDELRLSQQILERVKALVLVADADAKIIYVSHSAQEILGYAPEELLGDGWWRHSRADPAEAQKNKELLRRILHNQQPLSNDPYEREIRTSSGETRWIVWQDTLGPGQTLVGVGHDITERKRMEAQLADALQFTDQILISSPVGILTYKFTGECLSANNFAARLIGATVEQLRQQNFRHLDSWKQSGLFALAEQAIDTGALQTADVHIVSTFGKESWVRAQFVTFKSAGEDILLLTYNDITERKGVEEALREAESRYRNLVEHLPLIVYVSSAKEIVHTLYISPQVEMILGYSPEEWMAEPAFWRTALHPEDREAMLHSSEVSLSSETPFEMDYRMIARDGRVVWVHNQAVLIRDANGEPFLWQGVMIDITEQKRSEELIQHQDEELRKRSSEIERLYRASESLLVGALADLPTLAQNIVNTLLREFEQSNCSLLLVNKETRALERVAVAGPYAERVSRAKLGLDRPGLVAKAIRTRQVINIPDVTAEPDYVPNWEPARSELVIPLKIGDEIIGALDVQSPEVAAFHMDDERLMTIFAERAAFGLERARLYEQTKRQLEQLEGLHTIDLAISNSLDLRVSINTVLEQAMLKLGAGAASVLLFKPGLGRLEYFSGRGFRTHDIESTNLRLGEAHAGRAAFEKRIVVVADLSEQPPPALQELIAHEEFVSYYGVPLIAKGEVRGVLEIFHRRPFRPDMAWLNFLDALGWQTAIAVDNALLFEGIQRSNFELAMAYDETIEGWSRALDLRDKETEGHTQRVTETTLKLAEAMGFHGDDLVQIRHGALLHDIGKMGVPDHILLKPGPLTEEEWVSMKRHPQFAYEMLQPIAYLRNALNIPYCHHEKWDGTGYPRGLSGNQIPLEARLFAIVDVWDAITSDRPYRKKWTKRKALKYIREQNGKQFDPQVVEVFLKEIVGE